MKRNSLYAFFGAAIIVVIIDYITKYAIDSLLNYSQKVVLLPNVLSLEKVYNTGAAFSILQNNINFLIAISVITLAVIIYYVFTAKAASKTLWNMIGLGFVAGGDLGNLFDRLVFRHVVDFLQLEFINFPIFNFADVFINIGVIILLFSIMFNKND
ncbi:MAG: signal peptidase II [bacterium]|nr:signal peptidase II [bacterium]